MLSPSTGGPAPPRTIEQLDLDALGTAWFGEPVSLRRALVGVVYETARHTGHMDILRERTDASPAATRPIDAGGGGASVKDPLRTAVPWCLAPLPCRW